ncbi:hypothetical protein GGE68_005363 [Rhizobium leguminosarum]|uniref:hypothetical protein n=1 Tax=Rhizobium leguminosarum TaxID=384 RepID=UPI0016091B92|nr:hypothetical protein [Rhizobium leguminosarum]MBB5667124.1 hypothetical protein [Rhizobium leguminosarum]
MLMPGMVSSIISRAIPDDGPTASAPDRTREGRSMDRACAQSFGKSNQNFGTPPIAFQAKLQFVKVCKSNLKYKVSALCLGFHYESLI